jgi:chaperonin GroEL (HSP60 family)
MEKVGKEGVITVKEEYTIEDEIQITKGMRFNRGRISLYFITDMQAQKGRIQEAAHPTQQEDLTSTRYLALAGGGRAGGSSTS